MADSIVKVIKWIISISFFIVGIYCLRLVTDTGSVRPLILVIFSFGIVYWFSKSTYEASKKVFLTGLGVVLGVGVLARLFLWSLFIDHIYPLGFYSTWEVCTLAIGVPVMLWVYMKDG